MSISTCLRASMPIIFSAMSSFTFCTAFNTPLPRKRSLSPSRSSNASREPVDAPDGTAARPVTPLSSVTSTSTVGFPRESKISRACTSLITTSSYITMSFIAKSSLMERVYFTTNSPQWPSLQQLSSLRHLAAFYVLASRKKAELCAFASLFDGCAQSARGCAI